MMNNRAQAFWFCPAVTACAVALCISSQSLGRGAQEDLMHLWSTSLPRRGALHVQYQEITTGKRLLSGYDFESGAYYKAFSTYVGGLDTAGSRFSGRPVLNQVHLEKGEGREVRDATLDQFIPATVARDFLTAPEMIDSVTKSETGYVLRSTTPRGLRYKEVMPAGFDNSNRTVEYHFDETGRLVAIENYLGGGEAMRWNYDQSPMPELWVVKWTSKDTRTLIDFRFDPIADPSHFSIFGVERLSVAAALIEDSQPLWFGKQIKQLQSPDEDARSGKLPIISLTPQAAAGQASPKSTANSAKYQWYLVAAGVLVAALGILLKRRFG